jgi:hypothetical protein
MQHQDVMKVVSMLVIFIIFYVGFKIYANYYVYVLREYEHISV